MKGPKLAMQVLLYPMMQPTAHYGKAFVATLEGMHFSESILVPP